LSSTLVGAPAPTETFAGLGLPAALVEILARQGITRPLPIQAATIADALAGRDVSGKAPTGSGKTLAFALPIATRVRRGAPKRPRALVLAPTRELAAQIETALRPLLATRGRRCHAFYGGVGFGPQRNALRRGIDVAVACPGRLEDLMRSGDIVLADVETVVVDEADRMADMGFLPSVRRILDATAQSRQTLLFSATLDGEVDVLVRNYQNSPVRHAVEADTRSLGRASHRFDEVERDNRVKACAALVAGSRSTIVFVRTKHGADRLTRQLSGLGIAAAALHGGRSQAQRDRALAQFRSGRVGALVATDVAARGIHVDDVASVVHFDLPADFKDYVHRSGRTARAGADGNVVALVTPDQRDLAKKLRNSLPGGASYGAAPSGGAAPREGFRGAKERAGRPRARRSARPGSTTTSPRRARRSG
jgi:superfamily II DNA/RNA helicase